MARVNFAVTQSWQLAATAKAVFTVQNHGRNKLFFNDVASDTAEYLAEDARKGWQYLQDDTKDTYIRATGDNWVVTVDQKV